MDQSELTARKVSAIFISDTHLGSRACRAEAMLSFLKAYDTEHLFLIGDIIDFWAMSRGVYWPAEHNTVIQKILRKARHGTQVVLIPGNHDEALQDYAGTAFGHVHIAAEYMYAARDGRRYALLHGDKYDQVTACHRWVSVLGDVAYSALVRVNRLISFVRRKLGLAGHWSIADYAKRNVLRAVSFISAFEEAVVRDVRRLGVDGVVCGHIHTPVIKTIRGLTYMNCGDWVDNCTAIVEHCDGRMELVRWVHDAMTCDTISLAHVGTLTDLSPRSKPDGEWRKSKASPPSRKGAEASLDPCTSFFPD